MSAIVMYRICPDGTQATLGSLSNAHGGMPLIIDALTDIMDPLTPEQEARYRELLPQASMMRASSPRHRIPGRWHLDSMLQLMNTHPLMLGARPSDSTRQPAGTTVSRMFARLQDPLIDPLYRIALAATSELHWYPRAFLPWVAAAFRAVSTLARSSDIGLGDHVNHLDVMADALLAEHEASPAESIGVRIWWNDGAEDHFPPSDPETGEEIPIRFGDAGKREWGGPFPLFQPAAWAALLTSTAPDDSASWIRDEAAVLRYAFKRTGVDPAWKLERVMGESASSYLTRVAEDDENRKVDLLHGLFDAFASAGKTPG